MTRYLLDSDAVHILRKLELLAPVLRAIRDTHATPATMTEYAARHELSDIQTEIDRLVGASLLTIEAFRLRGPDRDQFRKLSVDKGEREAIAWAVTQCNPRPAFVSNDRRAREEAATQGLEVREPFELLVELVCVGGLDGNLVREKCAVWDDKSQQFGRPKQYTTFDETFERAKQKLGVR